MAGRAARGYLRARQGRSPAERNAGCEHTVILRRRWRQISLPRQIRETLRPSHIDRARPARTQLRTLLGLVHGARGTTFGQEHDFCRIRAADDFRRLVPLRSAVELSREYPEPGQTWPTASLPSREAIRSQRQALATALALVLAARPRSPLLNGRVLWLPDEPSRSIGQAERFPLLVRPSLRVMERLETNAPITCLIGPAGRIATEPVE